MPKPPVDSFNYSRCLRFYEKIFSLIRPVPKSWLSEPGTAKQRRKGLDYIVCERYSDLIMAWRKALRWTPGLDRALSVMLASIVSTKSIGDQLWVKIIGPASCGKSTLCEALSVAREYVYPKDTFTGLTSGYQVDKEGSENLSLANKLKDMTLLINDGDTLLQLPNLNQVLSQFRAFYGRNIRSQFKNKMSKDHEGISTTVIICGTGSLRELDTSELGERFVDCVIMDGIDDDLEDEINWRVANRSERECGTEIENGRPEAQNSPEMTRAMQMTGGYVDYLRKNSGKILGGVTIPEDVLRRCTRLGKFVAYMRARPNAKKEETAEREVSFRLVSIMVRLTKCLGGVLNRPMVDNEVMSRVSSVALDTARGVTLDLVGYMYDAEGVDYKGVMMSLGRTQPDVQKILRFLRKIGVTETYQTEKAGVRSKTRWRLTKRMRRLYEDVILDAHPT